MTAASLDNGRPVAFVTFTGRNAVFSRLVMRGAMLELVTFGFYRFWLTTDIRRHLWMHTEIDGDALEYTGRAKELLYGFLVALTVLGPVFLANFLVGLEFERIKAFTSLPLYLLLLAFGQFAAYRARRYRLTRTVWRGVRFWMTGSGWSYAWRSMLWGALLVPTLGLAYPWRMAALERFKLGHTFYGNLPGRFVGTGGALFGRVWWVWLLGLSPFVLLVCGFVALAAAGQFTPAARPPAFYPAKPPDVLMIAGGAAIAIGLLLCISLPFLHAVRRAREWEWWAGGLRFGEVAVRCNLAPGALIGTYWAMIGLSTLIVGVFLTLGAAAAAAIFAITHVELTTKTGTPALPAWGMVLYGLSYLITLLIIGAIARIFLLQRIWRHVAEACVVANIAAASDVSSAGAPVSAFGEGLADGLDFGL